MGLFTRKKVEVIAPTVSRERLQAERYLAQCEDIIAHVETVYVTGLDPLSTASIEYDGGLKNRERAMADLAQGTEDGDRGGKMWAQHALFYLKRVEAKLFPDMVRTDIFNQP